MRLNTILSDKNNLTEMIGCNHCGFFFFSGDLLFRSLFVDAVANAKHWYEILFYYFKSTKFKNILYILFILFVFGSFFAFYLSSIGMRLWPKEFFAMCRNVQKINVKKIGIHKILIIMQCIAHSRLVETFTKFTIIDNNLRFYCTANPFVRLSPFFSPVWTWCTISRS